MKKKIREKYVPASVLVSEQFWYQNWCGTRDQQEISDKFNISNQIYEQLADSHKQVKNFAEEGSVMIKIRPEQFSPGTVRKPHVREAGPSKILKKIGSNAYVIDLPSSYGISSIFKILDLIEYKEPALISSDPFWACIYFWEWSFSWVSTSQIERKIQCDRSCPGRAD